MRDDQAIIVDQIIDQIIFGRVVFFLDILYLIPLRVVALIISSLVLITGIIGVAALVIFSDIALVIFSLASVALGAFVPLPIVTGVGVASLTLPGIVAGLLAWCIFRIARTILAALPRPVASTARAVVASRWDRRTTVPLAPRIQ